MSRGIGAATRAVAKLHEDKLDYTKRVPRRRRRYAQRRLYDLPKVKMKTPRQVRDARKSRKPRNGLQPLAPSLGERDRSDAANIRLRVLLGLKPTRDESLFAS